MVQLMGELTWKVVKYLNLEFSFTEAIARQLNILAETSTYAIKEVEGAIANLESLEITLAEESGNVNFALVRADVLTYDQKMRVVGILMGQATLIQRLGKLMGVKPDLTAIRQFCGVLGVPFDRQIQGTTVRG